MPRQLTDLSPELHLMIVTHLLPDNIGVLDTDHQDQYNAEGNSAPSRDSKIAEKQKLSHRNLLNWSCTCHLFRKLIAPYIFHSLTIRNTETSAVSINTIISHPEYSKCVKEVQFIGSAPGDARRDDAAFSDTAGILPDSVREILAHLERFEMLEVLRVEFEYDFEDFKEWEDEGVNPGGDVESEEEVRGVEEREAWRALMVRTWEAVLENEKGTVKKLAIDNLYYRTVSTFTSPTFHTFLTSLSKFSLSIYGGDNGAGWHTNTCSIWADFVQKLQRYFFSHLTNVTSLTLRATEYAPLGLNGMNHAPLLLQKHHVPLLRDLYLEYIFLGPELRDFIVGHLSTLESIHLRNCLAESETSMAEDGIHWHELFAAMCAAQPSRLRSFTLSADRIADLPEEAGDCERYGEMMANREVEEDYELLDRQIEKVREDVEREREGKGVGKRVFPHVTVDDKYGMLFEDIEENFMSFQKGSDQEAFEELMRIVRSNAGDGR